MTDLQKEFLSYLATGPKIAAQIIIWMEQHAPSADPATILTGELLQYVDGYSAHHPLLNTLRLSEHGEELIAGL